MTHEKMRVIIAEHCGWKREVRKRYAGQMNVKGWGFNTHLPTGHRERQFATSPYEFPDFSNDLNAMAQARKSLTPEQQIKYAFWLFHRDTFSTKESRWWEPDSQPTFDTWLEEKSENAFKTYDATALEHATAFIHAIGRWEDG